jgi:chlorite dismutase
MPPPILVNFTAGRDGPWRIERIAPVIGASLPDAQRLAMTEGDLREQAVWTLRGVTSNARYTGGAEAQALRAKQEGLARPRAICAALIPIKKNAAWWELAQDERRAIVEEQSHHIAIGLEYLPGVARRLHHCRDLPGGAPFDFLTWFEFAPEHEAAFDELVARLRATAEWDYVEREVDVRVRRG